MKQRENLGSRILTGGAALFTAQAVTMVIYFLAQRIILSTLTKEANGVLFAERRFVDLFVILLVDFGMNIVAMRRMVQQPERAANILSSTVAFRVVVCSMPRSRASASLMWVSGVSTSLSQRALVC
jgi:hypothetical protein